MFSITATTLAIAGEPAGRFIADSTARPIMSGTHTTYRKGTSASWGEVKKHRVGPEGNAWKLRWRDDAFAQPFAGGNQQRGSERAVIQKMGYTESVPASEREGTPSNFHLVTQLGPLDPFDDPFGDHSPAPAIEEYSTSLQEAEEIEPAAPIAEDPPLEESFDEDAAPIPPIESTPSPTPSPARESYSEPCDENINDRNCCDEAAGCRKVQHQLLNSSIRQISLDITPEFTLAKLKRDGDRTYDEHRDLELAKSRSRAWRDREGRIVADGRMLDYRNGRVLVEDSDGNVSELPIAKLSENDNCFVTAWWSIPSECVLDDDNIAAREWVPTTLTWKASALCHKPLYFEEVQLERYGHTAGPIVQPVVSGAHFFLNVAALPYKMGINPPNECRYALGYYRPGNCAPWLLPPIPLSVRGALMEAGAIAGGVFVIP